MFDSNSKKRILQLHFILFQGLKMTLKIMDEEMPRNEGSISNRVALAKEVKIEKMMRMNKVGISTVQPAGC
jgi:hypothetical protein